MSVFPLSLVVIRPKDARWRGGMAVTWRRSGAFRLINCATYSVSGLEDVPTRATVASMALWSSGECAAPQYLYVRPNSPIRIADS